MLSQIITIESLNTLFDNNFKKFTLASKLKKEVLKVLNVNAQEMLSLNNFEEIKYLIDTVIKIVYNNNSVFINNEDYICNVINDLGDFINDKNIDSNYCYLFCQFVDVDKRAELLEYIIDCIQNEVCKLKL